MIELQSNNLYSTGKIIVFNDGSKILVREKLKLEQFVSYQIHIVKQNDELTNLAHNYYKDKVEDASKYWWLIADVNDIFDPFRLDLYIGKKIAIPNVIEVKYIIDSLQ